jgi:hypothetical protein
MLLLACVSILTGNFDSTKFGSDKTHDEVFLNIQDLANRIFFEEEYKQLEIENKRNALIEKLLC